MNIWLNGAIVGASGAIDARDRGVTLGDGVFETLAVIGGMPLRFERHAARLAFGAEALGIPLPYTRAALADALQSLCADIGMEEGSARITLLRGPAPRGIAPPSDPTPTVMITAALGPVVVAAPVRLIVAQSTRRNERSPLAAIKSANYLDAVIAMREAKAARADDAILLNTRDMVCEATAANVFCRFGDKLVTPPVSDGALPGIMRACIMAAEAVTERTISPNELRAADEVFLTSSLSVRPVIKIDGDIIGNGQPGSAATRLSDFPRRAE